MARDCSRYRLTKTASRANAFAVNLCIVKTVSKFSNTLDLPLIKLGSNPAHGRSEHRFNASYARLKIS
eukprot:3166376-Pleurochrysis_carterae.AAC.1